MARGMHWLNRIGWGCLAWMCLARPAPAQNRTMFDYDIPNHSPQGGCVLELSFNVGAQNEFTLDDTSGQGQQVRSHRVDALMGAQKICVGFLSESNRLEVVSRGIFLATNVVARSYYLWWKMPEPAWESYALITRRDASEDNRGFYFGLNTTFGGYVIELQKGHKARFKVPLGKARTWHLAAVVKEASGQWSVYHDGVKLAVTDSEGWPFDEGAEKNVPLWIGNDPVTGASFFGAMDEIRIYNRALTADEIGAYFRAVVGCFPW